MKRVCGKLRIKFCALIASAVMLIFTCTGVLSGCAGLFDSILSEFESSYEFYFTDSKLTMFVGDRYEFTESDFMFEPSAPSSFDFTLKSSNTGIVRVSGKTVIARSPGEITLTAADENEKTAICKIEVLNDESDVDLKLVAPTRTRDLSENREIDVTAIINDGAISADNVIVRWYANGAPNLSAGSTYTVEPASVAHSVNVKAKIIAGGNSFEDSMVVNFVDVASVRPVLSHSGSLAQSAETSSTVNFSLEYNDNNVTAAIDWLVNGEVVQRDSDDYAFKPNDPGAYEICALVNGALTETKTVTVSGGAVPKLLIVDYDTYYPQVKLSWQGVNEDETFRVRVVNNDTAVERNYTANAESLMLSASDMDIFENEYAVSVMSLGDGDLLNSSDYSPSVTVEQLPSAARTYLNKTYVGGNYYMTDDEEFFDLYDHTMLFREQPTNRTTSSEYNVYMGYDTAYSPQKLGEVAFNRSGYTGLYEIMCTRSGDIVKVRIVFETPSTPSSHIRNPEVVPALGGIIPHVSTTGRDTSFVPAIERRSKSVSVYTTDQLYRAAENGYRPVPESGSPAQKYYNYAKSVLRTNLDDGMSDVEKAHAIYDWIMARVSYNQTVLYQLNDVSEAVRDEAFYIESVLTNTNYNSVCDGMSKTYSLLCNMEEIPCLRIVGVAGENGVEVGHAWNKVMIDGEWYVVDCTWGDMQLSLRYSAGNKVFESASHAYFLKTDLEISETHLEEETADYPDTALTPYNYYAEQEYTVGGATFNQYVVPNMDLDKYATNVVALADTYLRSPNMPTSGISGAKVYTFEILLSDRAYIDSNEVVKSCLSTAARRKNLNCTTSSIDNLIFVTFSYDVRLG